MMARAAVAKARRTVSRAATPVSSSTERWELRLYVAGHSPKSAVPTLVRKLPLPIRKIIGDLSNTERLPVGLDLRPRPRRSRED